MSVLRTVVPALCFAVLCGAPTAGAQDPGGSAAETARPVQRVAVRPGRQPAQRRYVKIVQVPGPTPFYRGYSYEGTRRPRNWMWFSSYGPARQRGLHRAWTARYRPTPYRGYSVYNGRRGFRGYGAWRAGGSRRGHRAVRYR